MERDVCRSIVHGINSRLEVAKDCYVLGFDSSLGLARELVSTYTGYVSSSGFGRSGFR